MLQVKSYVSVTLPKATVLYWLILFKFRITIDASEHKPVFVLPAADYRTLISFLYPYEEISVLSSKCMYKKGE